MPSGFPTWLRRLSGGSDLRGCVDALTEDGLSGWAFDRAAPDRRLIVRVETDHDQFETFCADRYRADVQRADLGHGGYCGFFVAKRHLRRQGRPRVMVARKALAWSGPPSVQHRARPDQKIVAQANLCFVVDLPADPSRLTGWAADAGRPHDRCTLVLEADGRRSVTRACLFRPRPNDMSFDSFHGFSIAVPHDAASVRLFDPQRDVVLYRRPRDQAS